MQIRAKHAGSILITMRRIQGITVFKHLATALLLVVPALLHAQEVRIEAEDSPVTLEERGASVHIDNDLFSGSDRDRGYSWGATLTFGSPEPGLLFKPVDRARAGLASLLPQRGPAAVARTSQFGIIAMTPGDLTDAEAQPQDRPYASLVFMTSSELAVLAGGDRSRFTSLTLGVLGSGLAGEIQRSVHDVYGGDDPKGWDHEISDGGEPTARFVHAEQWLLGDAASRGGGLRQAKLTLAGSAGYLTEASAAVSLRWGRIHSPWWSFNPELGDYSPAPIAPVNVDRFGRSRETYAFVGARAKLRAYNALLQGQFRHSDVRVASDDVARFQAEAWAGVASEFAGWRVNYSVHVASREITRDSADRTLVWGSLSFTRAF